MGMLGALEKYLLKAKGKIPPLRSAAEFGPAGTHSLDMLGKAYEHAPRMVEGLDRKAEKALDLMKTHPVASGAALGAPIGAIAHDEDESPLEGALEGAAFGAGSSAIMNSPEIAKLLAKLGL